MPSGKLASSSFWNSRVFAMLICSGIYTVPCVSVARVCHVIPCFSIRWKRNGSLFIKCLTLILSWSLIVTTLQINFVFIESHCDFFPIYF